jgi:hypothetical protein
VPVVQVDDETVAMAEPGMTMRMAVRLGPLPALVLVLVVLVVDVQMLVLEHPVLMLELLWVGRRP